MRWSANSLGYEFKNPNLLEQALTHRSAVRKPDNERLEFLGDAFLNFTIAETLFQAQPGHTEGDLTKLRATLVRGSTLAELGLELALDAHIILGTGDLKTGGARRSSTMANALEAVIGAILLDGGVNAARSTVLRLYAARLADLPDPESLKDPKTRLQEWLQARGSALPLYEVTSTSGAPHDQRFEVLCQLPEQDMETTGGGRSRRQAEQNAARQMLDRLTGEQSSKS